MDGCSKSLAVVGRQDGGGGGSGLLYKKRTAN